MGCHLVIVRWGRIPGSPLQMGIAVLMNFRDKDIVVIKLCV